MEDQLGEIIVEKPSWRRWPIVFLFSLYGCHYSFQVSFDREWVAIGTSWIILSSCIRNKKDAFVS